MRISDWSSDVCSSDLLHRKRRLALTHETMLFLGSVGFFVLGHRPVSHTVAGGAGRTEGPFISADKALAVTLAAFGFRGFVHHADASTALIAPTTDSVSRARVSFRRSEEHQSELQSLMRISYAVFCLKKKKPKKIHTPINTTPTQD